MARKPKALVFDSRAVLAYFGDEGPAEAIANLISDAHESRIPMYMSVVNAGEAWYILAREVSEADADEAMAEVTGLGIQLVDVGWPLTRVAATLKANHKMSYADCYAAALAKERKCELVTGDKEFRQVDGEVGIRWV